VPLSGFSNAARCLQPGPLHGGYPIAEAANQHEAVAPFHSRRKVEGDNHQFTYYLIQLLQLCRLPWYFALLPHGWRTPASRGEFLSRVDPAISNDRDKWHFEIQEVVCGFQRRRPGRGGDFRCSVRCMGLALYNEHLILPAMALIAPPSPHFTGVFTTDPELHPIYIGVRTLVLNMI
jgi:hypothetical protein